MFLISLSTHSSSFCHEEGAEDKPNAILLKMKDPPQGDRVRVLCLWPGQIGTLKNALRKSTLLKNWDPWISLVKSFSNGNGWESVTVFELRDLKSGQGRTPCLSSPLGARCRLAESPRSNFGCFPCGNKKINNRRGCLLTPLAKLHLPFNTLPRVHKPLRSFFGCFPRVKEKINKWRGCLLTPLAKLHLPFQTFNILTHCLINFFQRSTVKIG